MEEKTERINFAIEPDLKAEADAISKETGIPVSALLRRGLKHEIEMLKGVMGSPVLAADRRHRERLESGEISEAGWEKVEALVDKRLQESGVFQEITQMVKQGKRLVFVRPEDAAKVEAAGGVKAGFHVDESGMLKAGPRPDANTNA